MRKTIKVGDVVRLGDQRMTVEGIDELEALTAWFEGATVQRGRFAVAELTPDSAETPEGTA